MPGQAKIGWGIIGLGSHVTQRILPALKRVPDAKLAAVCSRSMDRAESFARENGADRAYDLLGKMLADPALDVLYIASPNSMHKEHALEAAQARKHVLCEKPMALSEADAQSMIQACRKNDVKLGVVFQNRYHPAHVEAHRLIKAGEIGEINAARAQYCPASRQRAAESWKTDPVMAGAGALMGAGLHPIDLLRFLLDSEVVEVMATRDPEEESKVDDMVYVMLKFENGTRGFVTAGVKSPRSDNDAVLYGTKARILCKGTVGMPMLGELQVQGDNLDIRATYPTDIPMAGSYVKVLESFNRSVKENTAPEMPGENGLALVRIACAVLESSRTGRVVKIQRREK